MKRLSPYLLIKGESNGSWLITEIEVSFGSIIMGIYSQIINGSEIPNHKFQTNSNDQNSKFKTI